MFWWLESGQTVEMVNEEDSWKNFKLFFQFVFEKLRACKLMHFFNCEHNIIQVFCSKPFIQSSVRHRVVRSICFFLGLHVFLPRRVRTQCSIESSRLQMVRTKSWAAFNQKLFGCYFSKQIGHFRSSQKNRVSHCLFYLEDELPSATVSLCKPIIQGSGV